MLTHNPRETGAVPVTGGVGGTSAAAGGEASLQESCFKLKN